MDDRRWVSLCTQQLVHKCTILLLQRGVTKMDGYVGEQREDVLHYRRRRLPTFSPTSTHCWHSPTPTQRFFTGGNIFTHRKTLFHFVDIKLKADNAFFINFALSKTLLIGLKVNN